MSLAIIQQEFCDAILDEDAPLSALIAALPPDRLDIYRNAYRSRMLDCLASIFAKTKLWVGEDSFGAAAQDHIIRHPPFSKSLDDYGAGFDDTLATLFRDDPEVAELAWIEWALHRNFCASDIAALSVDNLDPRLSGPEAWDNAHITFVDNLIFGTACTNIAEIWPMIGSDVRPPAVRFLPDPVGLCIWRQEYDPVFRAVDGTELRAIRQLRNGATFGQLCDYLAVDLGPDLAAEQAGALFGRWLHGGMIALIDVA